MLMDRSWRLPPGPSSTPRRCTDRAIPIIRLRHEAMTCQTNPWRMTPPDLDLGVGTMGMNPDSTSIFDLSPSEKLQLVEDLWDDLAATTPDEMRVHDWQ